MALNNQSLGQRIKYILFCGYSIFFNILKFQLFSHYVCTQSLKIHMQRVTSNYFMTLGVFHFLTTKWFCELLLISDFLDPQIHCMAFSHSEATDKLCNNNKHNNYNQVQFPNIGKQYICFYCHSCFEIDEEKADNMLRSRCCMTKVPSCELTK